MSTVLDVLLLAAGLAVGHLLATRATRDELLQARARGLEDGRTEASWEIQRLRVRVQQLEAQLRKVSGTSLNGVGR